VRDGEFDLRSGAWEPGGRGFMGRLLGRLGFGRFDEGDGQVRSPQGKLSLGVLDLSSGEVLWSEELVAGRPEFALLLTEHVSASYLRGIEVRVREVRTGAIRWAFAEVDDANSLLPPVIAPEGLVRWDWQGDLVAHALADGSELWR